MINYEQEKKVSHLLHLVLSCLSFGFWLPIWFIVCLSVSLENRGIRKRNKKKEAALMAKIDDNGRLRL